MAGQSLNRVEVDLAALRYNYQTLRKVVDNGVEVMAMVKSDAYGHGLVPCARALAEVGAQTFGVAEIEEGIALRNAGIDGEIIVLLGAPSERSLEVLRYRLSPVVYDPDILKALSVCAEKDNAKIGVHLKVDIGMGRLGVMPGEALSFVKEMAALKGVYPAGVFGHFPLADAEDLIETRKQCRDFGSLVQKIKLFSSSDLIVHAANSAAMLGLPVSHFDMVRPGITLYGCYPSNNKRYYESVRLRPVMGFKTNIIQLKEVPTGQGLSYGHMHVTRRPTKLAVLPVGYDDGYLRRLAGRAKVLIKGQRAPILGMICMNACMADVTDIPGVVAGDEVVLMGSQADDTISADEIAAWSDTINYEILCLFGGRNRKEYIN